MAEFPKLPLWTDAYLGDTTHLTTIEHGAYLLLLIAMWRSKETRLPNDDKLLARYARLSAGQWARMKPVIMAFFTVEGCAITQPRLTDEICAVRQHSAKQSDKVKARWLKTKAAQDTEVIPEAYPEDTSLSLSQSPIGEGKPSPVRLVHFQTFWDRYPHRDGIKRNRAAAEKKYWLAVKSGISEQSILDGVERVKADPRVSTGYARDPTTWLNQRGWEDTAPAPASDTSRLDFLAARIRLGQPLYADVMTVELTEGLISRGDLTREAAATMGLPLAADPIRRIA